MKVAWMKRCSVSMAILVEVSGKRFTERHRVISGLCAGEAIAPWVFNGHCDTEVVLTWVKHVLVPELKPGLTVVIANQE